MPLDENITIGGVSQIALKKEYGARLTAPFFEHVPIQPIGRGATIALKGLWGNGCPSFGS
jgi:hypothetical protein